MANTGKTLFREKNLKAAADPEQLDGYLKVTGFGAWVVVLTAAIVLAALFIWVLFGKVATEIEGAGYCENGSITCYFALDDAAKLTKGTAVDIESPNAEGTTQGTVSEIGSTLYKDYDIPNEVLFLLPDSDWYGAVQVDCDAADGLCSVTYLEESSALGSLTN